MAKNPAAVALGKKRWANVSKADRSVHAKKAIAARWDKQKPTPKPS